MNAHGGADISWLLHAEPHYIGEIFIDKYILVKITSHIEHKINWHFSGSVKQCATPLFVTTSTLISRTNKYKLSSIVAFINLSACPPRKNDKKLPCQPKRKYRHMPLSSSSQNMACFLEYEDYHKSGIRRAYAILKLAVGAIGDIFSYLMRAREHYTAHAWLCWGNMVMTVCMIEMRWSTYVLSVTPGGDNSKQLYVKYVSKHADVAALSVILTRHSSVLNTSYISSAEASLAKINKYFIS